MSATKVKYDYGIVYRIDKNSLDVKVSKERQASESRRETVGRSPTWTKYWNRPKEERDDPATPQERRGRGTSAWKVVRVQSEVA